MERRLAGAVTAGGVAGAVQVARFQTENRQGTQPQKTVGAIHLLPVWDSVQAQRWVLS